ncbi:MAG: extracellular solute-binding protein, partial [Chloroflexota bacterium]
MNKKLWTILSILLVAVMILAACAPKEEAAPVVEEPVVEEPVVEEPVVEEPAPTEEPVVEEPAAPVATIRIWADDTRSAILTELADDFLEAYNVEVIVEEVANIRDQFTVAAPAGEGPDITLMPHDQAGSMVASGLLSPIDLGDKAANFVSSAVDSATYDGVLYGMPFATENLGFFYNTDMVSEAPATWDDV